MFKVADRRIADTYVEIGELMKEAIERIEENFARGDTITGTATGLPTSTSCCRGCSPRPSTSSAPARRWARRRSGSGMATHIAKTSSRPVLVFSLEMGHVELTQRILVERGRGRLHEDPQRHACRSRTGRKIGRAIGRLEVPLYLDDNPRVTVMEIRAKARRLKMQRGDLGLIMIDYLQLMSGSAQRREPSARGVRDQPQPEDPGPRAGGADRRPQPAQPKPRGPRRQAPDAVATSASRDRSSRMPTS